MAFSERIKHSLYYHYSPTYKYALGIEAVKSRHFDKDHAYFRFTYLLNRKNTQHSQRNLYFQSGVSSSGIDQHFYGVHGDWETRRWFAGFGYKHTQTKQSDFDEYSTQLGVAPYLGEYGDLHTWLTVKSKKNTLFSGWSTYPVLKLFKGNFLLELGYDHQAEWDAHLMYRF